jgi:hypothetical protein
MIVDHNNNCHHHHDCSLFFVGLVIALGTRSKRHSNSKAFYFTKNPNGSFLFLLLPLNIFFQVSFPKFFLFKPLFFCLSYFLLFLLPSHFLLTFQLLHFLPWSLLNELHPVHH